MVDFGIITLSFSRSHTFLPVSWNFSTKRWCIKSGRQQVSYVDRWKSDLVCTWDEQGQCEWNFFSRSFDLGVHALCLYGKIK